MAEAISSKWHGLCEAMAGRAADRSDTQEHRAPHPLRPRSNRRRFFFTGARDCPNREHGLFSDPQRRLAYRRVATVPVRRALQVRSALPARPTIPQLVRPRLGSRSHPSPMHRARALYARQAFLPAHSLRGNAERPPRSPGAQYPKRICVTLPECGASLRTVKRAP